MCFLCLVVIQWPRQRLRLGQLWRLWVLDALAVTSKAYSCRPSCCYNSMRWVWAAQYVGFASPGCCFWPEERNHRTMAAWEGPRIPALAHCGSENLTAASCGKMDLFSWSKRSRTWKRRRDCSVGAWCWRTVQKRMTLRCCALAAAPSWKWVNTRAGMALEIMFHVEPLVCPHRSVVHTVQIRLFRIRKLWDVKAVHLMAVRNAIMLTLLPKSRRCSALDARKALP